MLKQIKKILAVLLAVCFLATFTAGAVSAHADNGNCVVHEDHNKQVCKKVVKPVQKPITKNKPIQKPITKNKSVQKPITKNKPVQKPVTKNQ